MSEPRAPERENDEFWRDFLTRGHGKERRLRRIFRHIPHGPRCRMCAAPFAGVGAPFMRLIGKRPSTQNPTMCGTCFRFTTAAAVAAGLDRGLEHRSLDLKGKELPTEVVVLRA